MIIDDSHIGRLSDFKLINITASLKGFIALHDLNPAHPHKKAEGERARDTSWMGFGPSLHQLGLARADGKRSPDISIKLPPILPLECLDNTVQARDGSLCFRHSVAMCCLPLHHGPRFKSPQAHRTWQRFFPVVCTVDDARGNTQVDCAGPWYLQKKNTK